MRFLYHSRLAAPSRPGFLWLHRKRPANGGQAEQRFFHDETDKYPTSWSGDGKYVAYEDLSGRDIDIWAIPMVGGEHKPFAVLQEK
jgi:hypothetical protein